MRSWGTGNLPWDRNGMGSVSRACDNRKRKRCGLMARTGGDSNPGEFWGSLREAANSKPEGRGVVATHKERLRESGG